MLSASLKKNKMLGLVRVLFALGGKFYTSTKSWKGYIFTAVCLCVCLCVCLSVCVSVCPALLVNKIPAERMNRFGRGFRLMAAYRTGSNPIDIGDLVSKVKVPVM